MMAKSLYLPLGGLLPFIINLPTLDAFVGPVGYVATNQRSTLIEQRLVDPLFVIDGIGAFTDASINGFSTQLSASLEAFTSSNNLLAFTDQGQNLAGIFFQASLLPYLLFLYFLSFRGNRISNLANFGFQYVLLFVISTIPSGIISKAVYGSSLANVDYLHGGAELLLTVANILIVSIAPRSCIREHYDLNEKDMLRLTCGKT